MEDLLIILCKVNYKVGFGTVANGSIKRLLFAGCQDINGPIPSVFRNKLVCKEQK